MSTNAIEKALWQALSNPGDFGRFVTDMPGYLDQFGLDNSEKAQLQAWDVRSVVARGVNPLLIMMAFSAANGIEKMGEYAMAINQPPG